MENLIVVFYYFCPSEVTYQWDRKLSSNPSLHQIYNVFSSSMKRSIKLLQIYFFNQNTDRSNTTKITKWGMLVSNVSTDAIVHMRIC